jgi:hypothetical protein
MATPGGGSLRVYDRGLLDEVLGSPKVRAGAAKPPRRARRCIRDSSSRFRDPQYPPTRPSPRTARLTRAPPTPHRRI